MASFSDRYGIELPEPPIKYREDAPTALRTAIWGLAEKASAFSYASVIDLANLVLDTVYYPQFDSQKPLVSMAKNALAYCPWNQVYEAAERMYVLLERSHARVQQFEKDLNFVFRQEGIGWQMVHGIIEVRGSEGFEVTVHQGANILRATGRITAENELREAIQDLSRRPEPDITGAIQHAGAALECVARDVSGQSTKTLGEILKTHPQLLPKPLDEGAMKLWGFVSNFGRHVKEGHKPSFEEALLVTGLAASLSAFIAAKNNRCTAPV